MMIYYSCQMEDFVLFLYICSLSFSTHFWLVQHTMTRFPLEVHRTLKTTPFKISIYQSGSSDKTRL